MILHSIVRFTQVARLSTVAKALRNVGIIAHIDAGKTTTTERILFNAGKIKFVGEVDKGTTVTDYLEQERERGISITSATAIIKWKDHSVNVIDTPGHVDFSLEVERALTVLDGSVTILDSTKGVEAQTQTVWIQSKRHKIPNIFYLNKFDRKNSNLNLCLKSIMKKLPNVVPLVIHLPYYSEETGEFSGIVDIVELKLYQWDISSKLQSDVLTNSYSRKISTSEPLFKSCIEWRLKLLEALVDIDDGLIRQEFLMLDNPSTLIPNKMIHDSLRKVTIAATGSPVLIGSSRLNIGVSHLLDKIVEYLPNPTEKQLPYQFSNLASHPDHLSALAFKVLHDNFRGSLTFLRLYSGLLKPNSMVKNLTRGVIEKVDKIIQMTGDHYTELDSCSSGNIVAVSGLKNCFTGDVLVDLTMPHISDEDIYSNLIPIPSPVIFSSIEAYSISEIKALETALSELVKEDPSLNFHRDEDSNQLIVGGMGNLHLEVVIDRIKRAYKLPKTRLGKLKIVYKECPNSQLEPSVACEHLQRGKVHGNDVSMLISMTASCSASYRNDSDVEFVNSKEFTWGAIHPKVFKMIKTSVADSFHAGGSLLKTQLLGTKVHIHKFTVEPSYVSLINKSSHPLLRSCVYEGMRELFKKIDTDLLEPVMDVEISLSFPGGDNQQAQYYMSKVQNDLNKRRAHIISAESSTDGAFTDLIKAFVPLSEVLDYSNTVRTLTSGYASIHMKFSHYERMSTEAQEIVTKSKLYRSPNVNSNK